MSTEGKIQIQSTLIPTNDNPRMPVTDVKYIKGAPQIFGSLAELVEFHPNRMIKGMTATISGWPGINDVSHLILKADPALLVDANGDSIITENNFNQYWNIDNQSTASQIRVRQYAPDSAGGGAPVYPYTLVEEVNWSNTFDPNQGHKWMRMRDDDVDDNADGIFDNWTAPIAIVNAFSSGDYIDKRFKREGTAASFGSQILNEGGLVVDNYYVVDEDDIEITGNLSLIDIGEVTTSGTTVLTIGRVFKYVAGLTYNFNYGTGAGKLRKIIKTPPRTVSGTPNNEPAGWFDAPPVGTDQLWEISGQKSVYGQLKSEWLLKKVVEDPNYTRYSTSPSPHPDTLCGVNDSAATSSPADIRLEAAGWHAAYSGDESFIARRTGGSPPYSAWLVEKISEESGEYVDRVFKLFDINLDLDGYVISAPTDSDATRQGWSDTPLVETATQINFVSEARKFFDGTLKTAWSQPVPFTGKDVFNDTIESTPADNFRYDSAGNVTPSQLTLTARLYKGVTKLWEEFGVTISYAWKIVYNDGAVVDIAATGNPVDDFYTAAVTGSGIADSGGSGTVINDAAGDFITKGVLAGDKIWNVTDGSYATVVTVNSATQITTSGLTGGADNTFSSGDVYFLQVDNYVRAGQVAIIKPAAIIGAATVRCTQTITMAEASNLIFEEEISLLDVTDGKDAKALTITADNYRFLYDSVGLVFSPLNLVLRAYHANLPGVTLYWYYWNGSSWSQITNGVNNYSISGNVLSSTAANRFLGDSSHQEIRYAVSTLGPAGNPEAADYEDSFSDFLTIAKLSASNIGVDGENAISAILTNESHTVVLDSGTTLPATGEVAKATTRLEVYDGNTKLDYHLAEFSIALGGGESTYFSVTDPNDATGDAVISLINATWVAGVRSYQAHLAITYGGITINKVFSLSSTLDAPGAIVLDIDSDKGFVFTPTDKSNKTLTAKLYNTALDGDQSIALPGSYYFQWVVAGVTSGWSNAAGAHTKVITQANILVSANVTVRISESPSGTPILRERTISLSDVMDGRAYRAWTETDPGSNVLTNQDPTSGSAPNFVGGVANVPHPSGQEWRLQGDTYWNTHSPLYSQDAYINPSTGAWVWTPKYRIKGETGDQGGAGHFQYAMYKATYRIMASETTLAQFAAASGSYTFTKGSVIYLNAPGPPYYYNGGTKTLVGSYDTTLVPPDFANGNSDTATLAQMLGSQTAYTDWFSRPPAAGVIWKTERLWNGESSPGVPVTFNVNGDPDSAPVSGAKWAAPVKLTSLDGTGFAGPTEYDTMNASFAMTGGGTVTWDSWNHQVTWTQPINAMVNNAFGTAGFFNIGADTVILTQGQALYYAPPRLSGSAYNASYLKVKTTGDGQIIGDTWVFIAKCDNDDSLLWAPGSIRLPYDSNTGTVTYNSTTGECSWIEPRATMKWKTVNIGVWNMDSTSSVNVAHGIAGGYSRIKVVDVMIRNDADSFSTPLNSTDSSGWIAAIDGTNITLQRGAAGAFDNTNYDLTTGSYNRGWVTIGYI